MQRGVPPPISHCLYDLINPILGDGGVSSANNLNLRAASCNYTRCAQEMVLDFDFAASRGRSPSRPYVKARPGMGALTDSLLLVQVVGPCIAFVLKVHHHMRCHMRAMSGRLLFGPGGSEAAKPALVTLTPLLLD